MATSCLFTATVIAVLSTDHVHGHNDRKAYIIDPVSNRHVNGRETYWSLEPIERGSRVEDQRYAKDKSEHTEESAGAMNRNERQDYSDDRLSSIDDSDGGRYETPHHRYLNAKSLFPRVGIRKWDGQEGQYESGNGNAISKEWIQDWNRRPNTNQQQHRVRNIKNDYKEWKKMRDRRLYHQYISSNDEHFWNRNKHTQYSTDENSLSEELTNSRNGYRDGNDFFSDSSYHRELDGTDGLRMKKDYNRFVNEQMWEQLRHEYFQRPGNVRQKRSPKMTRAKILKRQRRKKRRKEIRQQRKRMRIIKHSPDDDKYVPSEEDKKRTITYDYSTHEEGRKNDLDEEFVSKMDRGGELGELGEGSSESDENKAKEVTDDDKKKKKKTKKDGDKQKGKKGGDKPKVKKGGDKPKWKKSGGKGKSKKGGSKKGGGKKGKKDKGKGKGKKKAAGRDTKGKQMLTNRNLNDYTAQHGTIDYWHHTSVDRPRAFVANQHDVDRGQQTSIGWTSSAFGEEPGQPSAPHEHYIASKIRHVSVSSEIAQHQFDGTNHQYSPADIKKTARNKLDAAFYERQKVLADFRKIFGEKNTVKLLMDKHRSKSNENNTNNKILFGLYNSIANKRNAIESN